jgi:putative salt-induced outer membrane protein
MLAICVAPRAVSAQAAAPEPRTRTTIEVGLVAATGNTSIRTLNAAEQFVLRAGAWRFTQSLAVVNGSTNGVETANNIRARVRADVAVASRLRAYAIGAYERNRFAGIRRRFEEQVGFSVGALAGPRHLLEIEAGAGLNQQATTSAPVIDYWLGRAAAHYRLTFRPNTYVDERVEVLQSLETAGNRRVNSEAAVVAPLSSRIALRFGYAVRFNNDPPDDKKKTDQVVSSGLQIIL